VKLNTDYIDDFAKKSGVDKRIVKKYLKEIEDMGVDWQYFDLDTIADEIRDFSQTGGKLEHKELRKRLGLSKELDKRAEEEAREQEIESQLYDKPGVKNLLKRVYEKDLSDKEKNIIKEKIISGAPQLATLIALHNGGERDYAKEFLKEMIFSPTSDIKELLKGDTIKIKSGRGWVYEINDIPLKKKIRSIDLIEKIKDYEHVASSSPSRDYTIAVFSKNKQVEEKPPIVEVIASEPIKTTSEVKKGSIVDDFTIPESRPATGGNPLTSTEFCYRCGREVLTDEYSQKVNGDTVYFCSKLCYHAGVSPVIPKYGIGQTVTKDTIAEMRKKPIKRVMSPDEKFKPVSEERPITTEEVVTGHLENVTKRAEELATAYSYGELKKLGNENNIRLKGNKIKMISELIRANVL